MKMRAYLFTALLVGGLCLGACGKKADTPATTDTTAAMQDTAAPAAATPTADPAAAPAATDTAAAAHVDSAAGSAMDTSAKH